MIRTPPPTAAVYFVAGVAVVFVPGGAFFQALLGEGGVLAAQWLLLFLPALLFVRTGGYDLGETLSLRMPKAPAVAAALLLVAGAAPVAWAAAWAQSLVTPMAPEAVQAMEDLVTAGTPARMVWLLVALAVTPAICEEVVFRGVLLSASRTMPEWRAVLLNGVVFGAFHLSFETPVRFLPTAWLGIVIAWVVLRSGSLWSGVLMHLFNNGIIVVLASLPAWGGLVTDPDAPPPLWLMAVALSSLAAGARILTGPHVGNGRRDPSTKSEGS
jgi:membrane protease YdiL (CAAX protease family)